jgi:hypothetical protein
MGFVDRDGSERPCGRRPAVTWVSVICGLEKLGWDGMQCNGGGME